MEYLKRSDERYNRVMDLYKNYLLKKMWSCPYGDHIIEWYVDSRDGGSVVLQWSPQQTEPQIILPDEGEWQEQWNEYSMQGRWVRSAKTWRADVAKAKTQAVNALNITATEQFNIRLYEAVKYVMKDARFKTL